jgi:hypothetical protein
MKKNSFYEAEKIQITIFHQTKKSAPIKQNIQ